jgi:hypothetical protein
MSLYLQKLAKQGDDEAAGEALVAKGNGDQSRLSPHCARFCRRCDWPPKPWSDGDGYSEIWVQPTVGPGKTEASGADMADVIKSSCNRLKISYSIVAQGYQKSLPAFTSEPNRTVWHDGRPYRVPPQERLNFYYERDELVVLRNAKIRLDRVKCVE